VAVDVDDLVLADSGLQDDELLAVAAAVVADLDVGAAGGAAVHDAEALVRAADADAVHLRGLEVTPHGDDVGPLVGVGRAVRELAAAPVGAVDVALVADLAGVRAGHLVAVRVGVDVARDRAAEAARHRAGVHVLAGAVVAAPVRRALDVRVVRLDQVAEEGT